MANFSFKAGKPSRRDGYRPLTYRCEDCGKVIAKYHVGNAAGGRWASHFAHLAIDSHVCGTPLIKPIAKPAKLRKVNYASILAQQGVPESKPTKK